MEKRRYCSLGAISPLFHNILLPVVKTGTRFSLRDKQLFEISRVEITRVGCVSATARHSILVIKCGDVCIVGSLLDFVATYCKAFLFDLVQCPVVSGESSLASDHSCVGLVIRRLQVRPLPGRQHSFMEIDHEIFSMVILSFPLIQEGQLSVSYERMCRVLVNRLED